MPDSVRVRYPLSLIVFPKPESNSFPKLRLVDFYSHHATPRLSEHNPPSISDTQTLVCTHAMRDEGYGTSAEQRGTCTTDLPPETPRLRPR